MYYREPKGSTEVLKSLDPATIERVVSTRGDKENDRVATRVDHVDLFFDSDFLTDGVTLVDSPGLNGTADHHREITEEQICRSSACIFLFNAEQPGSKSNFDFLRELKSRNSNIFFVLNKINTIKTAEGETVEGIVNHIARIYHEQFPEETQIPHIWPISANEALTARDLNIKRILAIWGNERSIDTPEERERLEKKSRMKNFEDHLWNYLTNGARARDQLLSPLGSTLKALSAQKEGLKTQIEMLEQESGSEELEQQKQKLYREARKLADALTQTRVTAFDQLNKQITKELDFLNMPGVRFALSIRKGPLASAGQDVVEFLISANPGEEPKPLAKIASGGELSRIMLAIQTALAEKDDIPTIIYDEIDTGVSGLAASRIGRKLHQSSKGRQVLCITHTAQIAAMADHHLLIQKNVEGQRTYTEIHPLDETGRMEALARIISGDQVTELSLANAKEMLEKARGLDNPHH